MIPVALACIGILASVLVKYKVWRIGHRAKGLPPGPPTKWLTGNVTQIPRAFPHLRFASWAKEYGEIFSLKAANETIIILTSPLAIKEILDKQGSKTGDRLAPYMGKQIESIYMVTDNLNSHVWKTARKAMQTFMSSSALESYWPTQEVELAQYMNDLIDTPDKFYTHTKRTIASVITKLLYGKRLPTYEGTEAEDIFDAVALFSGALDSTAHPPVDFLPFLKYVPERWASWKDLIRRAIRLRRRLFDGLFDECERKVHSGQDTGSYLERVIWSQDELNMTREEIKALGKTLTDGGAQTSTDFLLTLALALINNPESQKEAQAELDRVIGSDRLPQFEDLADLPYLIALIKELHRYRPTLPLAFAHIASQDLKYKDYFIPKRAIILPNTWGIYHDPDLFYDPDSFKPERFLKSEFGTRVDIPVNTEGFRDTLPFGAGRRICPGIVMATRTVALNAMNLLWAFSFAKDDSGTGGIGFDRFLAPGIQLTPMPYTCRVVCRDEKRAKLIKEWYSTTSASEFSDDSLSSET